MRRSELKQILKYPNGIVACDNDEPGRFDHLPVVPIPLLAFVAGC